MIVDTEDETGQFDTLEENTQKEQPQVETPVVEELPEKYKGKTVAEIAKMHAEAEKLISRQAAEVHEVRQLADGLIKQQINKAPEKPQVVEEPEVDFFENPNEAVRKVIESSADIRELREWKKQQKAAEVAKQLSVSHPDAFTIVRTEDFANWVKASKTRLDMFTKADAEYDVDAANELLLSYKAQRNIATATKPQVTTPVSQEKAFKAGMVDTNGSTEGVSKKVYRRADIIKLMQTDPDRYQAMQPEIMQAYAEKRVR